jgi:hypothetical protein
MDEQAGARQTPEQAAVSKNTGDLVRPMHSETKATSIVEPVVVSRRERAPDGPTVSLGDGSPSALERPASGSIGQEPPHSADQYSDPELLRLIDEGRLA